MKISDFIFKYPNSSLTSNDGICRVRIFINRNQEVYAVLTDLGNKNTGGSVTNSIESIKDNLILKGYIDSTAKLIENYEDGFFNRLTFDYVTFNNNGSPNWEKMGSVKICSILGCKKSEFETKTLEISRLYDEIERIRHSINPYIDEPYLEPFEVINRRDDIRKNMLSAQALMDSVEKGVIESDIQKLIKSDLSIIGETYSTTDDEYVCFSEFPVGDGFVDYVVFSGRSRMDVTLVEIKGANYNLVNKNSYEDFSAKTNQAVQQIRKRLGYITRNYEDFRCHVHKIRLAAESGEDLYGSFWGPQNKILVSHEKDINIHTIVIGGRSRDDLKESKLRHDYEREHSPSIRVESWDSWIKKLKRYKYK